MTIYLPMEKQLNRENIGITSAEIIQIYICIILSLFFDIPQQNPKSYAAGCGFIPRVQTNVVCETIIYSTKI